MLLKIAKNLLGRALTTIGSHLAEPEPTAPTASVPELPKRERPPYNPKIHATFKLIAPFVVHSLLQDDKSKAVSVFIKESDDQFAPSSVRGVCKELLKDGIITQVPKKHPAEFQIETTQEARDRAEQFLREFPSIPIPVAAPISEAAQEPEASPSETQRGRQQDNEFKDLLS